MNGSPSDKDLHYLVTRIINPSLNTIIAKLYDNKVLHYRDYNLDVKEYSIPTLVAKALEDWRDELWHKYSRKNLSGVYMEFISDYSSTINYVYSRLYHVNRELAEDVKPDLILLGQKIEEYLTGKIEVFSNFTFEVEKNKSETLPQEDIIKMSETKLKENKTHKKEEESPDFGICPRCAVYDGDKRKKKLYQCPYCGEWFCEKHVKPSLMLTFGKYKELWGKYKDLREFLDKEWHREDGHPCYPYTQKFWRDYENKRKPAYVGKDNIARMTLTHDAARSYSSRHVGTSKKQRSEENFAIVEIRDSKITRPGRFYIDENGWVSIIVNGTSLRAYVPPSRVKIYNEDGKRVLEIDRITDNDIRNFDLKELGKADISPPPEPFKQISKFHEKKSKGKYLIVGIALLLLILVGYLYSQGSFDDIKTVIFGSSHDDFSQETNTYMPSYTDMQTLSQTPPQTTETPTNTPTVTECSSGYWRYILEDALKCALTEEELSKISYLANQLKGKTLQESAWDILEWLDENIEYNYSKTLLPAPTIWTLNGKTTSVTAEPGVEIQTPYETVQKGAGVCKDYAILTTALLLEMGYSPVYVFDINFENSQIGHVATAIKINDEYFLLDQHPPAMDLGTYYRDWSIYRKETLGETLLISNANVYEVRKSGKNVAIKEIDVLTAEDFKSKDHEFSSMDLTRISEGLKEMFQENYPSLILDSGIKSLDTRTYLPPGYSDGITWRVDFPHFVDYYNPVFQDEFVEYFYTSLTSYEEIKKDLSKFNRFWIKVAQEGDSIKVILNLAKK